MSSLRIVAVVVAAGYLAGCADLSSDGPSLSKKQSSEGPLRVGQRIPDAAEAAVIGPLTGRVVAGSVAFARLVRCDDPDIVFKDEEGTGADRMMTPELRAKLRKLSVLVSRKWPALRLRVTEAWDGQHEHGANSVHYEGRAADITTSDMDPEKLGRLAGLAIHAGFDWVFYEDGSHVHVSVAHSDHSGAPNSAAR